MKAVIKYSKGNIVKETRYGRKGIITKIFKNWNDLKVKEAFLTIDPSDESNKMDSIEKLINGDPKDAWLDMQDISYTKKQLKERWFSIRTFNGGAIMTCESQLELVNPAVN